ncbi:zinc ribbon domain-containing protein [Natrononativus amylolyticus]|uniref:zinc ribbon domain-containing protein n=1 Tax=Natrononativus amylolyticus TaxID=2963434 RepID=UPI0020CFC6B6|nr:zinc ribbon domain-containing protein [Natrononativus amylolyticus]
MNNASPTHCSNCGEGVTDAMNFCPNCGTATSLEASRPANGEEVTDREVLEHRIRLAMNEGWGLEHDFGDHAVLIKRSFGALWVHILVGFLTLSATMGLGNVLYAAYSYYGNPTRAVVDADGDPDAAGRPEPSRLERATATVAALLLWFCAAVLLAFAALLWAEISVVVTAGSLVLALAFAGAGFSTFPPSKRRLEERGPPSKHGRVAEVDERWVDGPDEDCSDCGGTVDRGLERTYRDEVALFGVALSKSEATDVYCRHCVRAERRLSGLSSDGRERERDCEMSLERV